MTHISESQINIISEGTRIEGEIQFDHVTRVHGVLSGQVKSSLGSTLILSETAVVEGTIDADTLMIDGYVQGKIEAKTKVVVSRTGRVIGTIKTPCLHLEFGAYFEGQCAMESQGNSPAPAPVLKN